MRCPYCGSKMLYPATEHKTFSAGKAVAGYVALGVVGAAAGFIGKDKNGYRCSACGAFTERSLDLNATFAIDSAVRDAEAGKNISAYEAIKRQYPNVEAVVYNVGSVKDTTNNTFEALPDGNIGTNETEQEYSIKNSYNSTSFVVGCPVWVKRIAIKSTNDGDKLSLLVHNVSDKTIRSVYFDVKVYDDVGDEILQSNCVYQGMSVERDAQFPDKEFDLKTDIAYKVDIKCVKAAFEDDSIWRFGEDTAQYDLLPQAQILPENFPKYKYLKMLLNKKNKAFENCEIFQPLFEENFYQCICGYPVTSGQECPHCGMNEKELEKVLSYDNLLKCQHKTIKDLAQKRFKATDKLITKSREEKYNAAMALLKNDKIEDLDSAILIFKQITGYKDANDQLAFCEERKVQLAEEIKQRRLKAKKEEEERRNAAEHARQKEIYDTAVRACELITGPDSEQSSYTTIINCIKKSISELETIPDYKDSQELVEEYRKKVSFYNYKFEEQRRKRKVASILITFLAITAIVFVVVIFNVINSNGRYEQASLLMNEGNYTSAASVFEEIDGYKDSEEMRKECIYQQATIYLNNRNWDAANPLFEEIKDYKDSDELIHYHQYAVIGSKDATCAVSGYKNYKCDCGEEYTDTLFALGHKYSSATCTSASKCTRCNKTDGSALGHTTDRAKCSRCGKILFKTRVYSGAGDKKIYNISLPKGSYEIEYRITNATCGIYDNITFSFLDRKFECTAFQGNYFHNVYGPISNETLEIYTTENDMRWRVTIKLI